MRDESPGAIQGSLKAALSAATKMARQLGWTGASMLEGLADRLDDDRVVVAVLGGFNRGKSSFVNALLGSDVLPVGVLPLTNLATELRWGAELGAVVGFADGSSQTIDLEELASYVTEAGNPANHRGVDSAFVRLPAEILSHGLVILDTPGVGSVHRSSTDVTERLVPQVDAAIFVTAVDPPISEEEIAFLHRVRPFAAKLLFVVNKVDLVNEEDRRRVLGFTGAVIEEAVGVAVTPFALSSRFPGTDEGFDEFRSTFRESVATEKRSVAFSSVARKLDHAVAELRIAVRVETETIQLSAQEIDDRLAKLAAMRRRTERVRDDLIALARREMDRLIPPLDQRVLAWRAEETVRLFRESADGLDSGRVPPTELDAVIKELLRTDFETWRPKEEAAASRELRAAMGRFVEEADVATAEAELECSRIVDVDLPPRPSLDGISPHSRFVYSTFEAPTIVESLLPDMPAILPGRLARRTAKRRILRKIAPLVERQATGLRNDLVARMREAVDGLTRALDERLASILETVHEALEHAAEHARQGKMNSAERAGVLRQFDDDLAAIADELSRIGTGEVS